ncbi:MAG: fibrobacter succinogenes major paralogous domain-containing protein [Bacteroidales bacterium]|nr:fibrobacter succinogenes major paralogous domain-containing protein [Bacteroidales bacterium]
MKTTIRFSMPAILFALSSFFLTNCKDLPEVSTNAVTEVTQTTATSGGVINSDGGAIVTENGVCWSTSKTPTIADNKTTDGSGAGSFTSAISGLTANTTYYVRAYATNSAGTGYGSAKSFTTLEGKYGTMTDIDGNTYKTVTIGTQTWMAENLKVTKYNDGTAIPNVTDYDNDPSKVATYGRLYNWHAVNTGKLCPTGWHVPTNAEWAKLSEYLGGDEVAGGKLKETGTTHWHSPNTGATNESGFTALPGGYRFDNGTFNNIGYYGLWWSSTESNSDIAYYWGLDYDNDDLSSNNYYKVDGFSVRCVRD